MSTSKDMAEKVYTITVSVASRNLRPIFNKVYHDGKRILMSRHGDERVAIVPIRDYKRLIKLDAKKRRGGGIDESWEKEEGIESAVEFSPTKKIEKHSGKERAGRPLRFRPRASRLSK